MGEEMAEDCLQRAEFTSDQAAALAHIIAQLPTKSDLAEMEMRIRTDISQQINRALLGGLALAGTLFGVIVSVLRLLA